MVERKPWLNKQIAFETFTSRRRRVKAHVSDVLQGGGGSLGSDKRDAA